MNWRELFGEGSQLGGAPDAGQLGAGERTPSTIRRKKQLFGKKVTGRTTTGGDGR